MAGKIADGAKRLWANPHVQVGVRMFTSMLVSRAESDQRAKEAERALNSEQLEALKRGREVIAKEKSPYHPFE